MKKQHLLIVVLLMVFCCSCDAFLMYHLTVKDKSGGNIGKVEVTDMENGLALTTDSSGFITLTKVTGGIRPQRKMNVSLHKAGFHDTTVTLTGSTTLKLRKQ